MNIKPQMTWEHFSRDVNAGISVHYQPHSTSLAAYSYIQPGGKIGLRQTQVFSLFVNSPPMSSKETHKKYCEAYHKCPVDSVSPRIRELLDFGMLVYVGKHKCSVTGHIVEFSRAAEPGEVVEIKKSTKQETKKMLKTSLLLVKLWRNQGSLEDKRAALEKMQDILQHFYPEEISGLKEVK